MKRLYIPALLLVAFVTTSLETKPAYTSKSDVTAVKSQIEPTDTITATLSSEAMSIPINTHSNAQIIILKEKESPDSLKTLVPLFFTLTGLIFGFLLNRFYDWYSNKRRIKKSGRRWVIELRTIKGTIKQQITAIEEFSASLRQNEWLYDALVFITTVEGDTFSSLDKNDLLDYIESKNTSAWHKRIFMSKEEKSREYQLAVKISNRTHGFISTLGHNYSLLSDRFNSFNDGISTLKKFNDDLEVLRKYMNELNFQVMNGIDMIYNGSEYSELLNLYIALQKRFVTDANFNPLQSDKMYLEPMLKALLKLERDKRILPISNVIAVLIGGIKNINSEREHVLSNMDELIRRYEDSLASIDTVANNIEGKGVVQSEQNSK